MKSEKGAGEIQDSGARARASAAAVWMPIGSVEPWSKNPRKHDVSAMDAAVGSLRRFGFCAPVVVWGSRSMMVAGHLRTKALKAVLAEDPKLDGRGGADPDLAARNAKLRASLTGPGVDHVPVRVREFDSVEEAEAYALRDNNQIGAWDDDALNAVLKDLQESGASVDGLGWSDDQLASMLSGGGDDGGGLAGDDDAQIEVPQTPVSVLGEVYQLGPHRLVCGSATDPAAWAALMGAGEKLKMMWTDPPYGVSYVGGTKEALRIKNDDLTPEKLGVLLRESFTLGVAHSEPGASWYVASPAMEPFDVFARELTGVKLRRHTLVWVKDQFVLGRSDYHYQHEPIFYGWVEGAPHYFVDERTHTSVLSFPRPKQSTEHPTMKPPELIRHCIRNSSKPGWLVGDSFGGSGSTLVAAAQEGRIARLIELDPRFCDVIRRRWTRLARASNVDPGVGALE